MSFDPLALVLLGINIGQWLMLVTIIRLTKATRRSAR